MQGRDSEASLAALLAQMRAIDNKVRIVLTHTREVCLGLSFGQFQACPAGAALAIKRNCSLWKAYTKALRDFLSSFPLSSSSGFCYTKQTAGHAQYACRIMFAGSLEYESGVSA